MYLCYLLDASTTPRNLFRILELYIRLLEITGQLFLPIMKGNGSRGYELRGLLSNNIIYSFLVCLHRDMKLRQLMIRVSHLMIFYLSQGRVVLVLVPRKISCSYCLYIVIQFRILDVLPFSLL